MRASQALPSSCSGAMYAGVPRTVKGAVKASVSLVTELAGCMNFARPKSRTLSRSSEQMFSGLKSPVRSSAGHARRRGRRRSRSRGLDTDIAFGLAPPAVCQRLTLDLLHDHVVGPRARRRRETRGCWDGSGLRWHVPSARSVPVCRGPPCRSQHLDCDAPDPAWCRARDTPRPCPRRR